ncbi:UNVERIFIED_CONTAM: protein phosphatase 2C 70 [Sesamum latifolium]|uniref:protein-serine/threonine phosphatase n=1 Tax=Sesamum latifolium TaxID=2727402 RepID=A0AAW2W142_9LAMI
MEKAMRVGSGSIWVPSSVLGILILILMLLLIIILILIACKFRPWRRFLSPFPAVARRRSSVPIKVDDIERPLILGDLGVVESQNNASTLSNFAEQAGRQSEGGDSFVLDIPNTSDDSLVGQTLKRPHAANQFGEKWISEKREDITSSPNYGADKDSFKDFIPTYTANRGSSLMLEVISGASRGLQHSMQSTNTSKLPKLKWELVDMGSLNGTFLNSQAVHLPQSGSRHWSNPVELSNGDVITLGTTSKIQVHITAQAECKIPFGVGIVSDPMALRRGGKKLPMEDVCYYQWPLPGVDQFGLFGICDGHGEQMQPHLIMPEVIAGILSVSFRKERVLSQCDASDVLREAFYQTEARINNYYEGCTATVLLVWADGHKNFYAQCANVGDSACFMNIEGKQIKMTEDHRITSHSERLRIQALGPPLRDGETRICGINLARMLGDKFLKEQDTRFSSEPYISEVVCIEQSSKGFALLASDGFWDVINIKKAVQLVHQIPTPNTQNPFSQSESLFSSDEISESQTEPLFPLHKMLGIFQRLRRSSFTQPTTLMQRPPQYASRPAFVPPRLHNSVHHFRPDTGSSSSKGQDA